MRIVLLVVSAFYLASCANLGRTIGDLLHPPSLSEAECTNGHWGEYGFRDGLNGRASQSAFQDHAQACERYQIVPVVTLYQEGWDKGVLEYCTETNGRAVGLQGKSYQHVCPKSVDGAFLAAYEQGRRIHSIRVTYNNLEHELDRIGDKITTVTEQAGHEPSEHRRRELYRDLMGLQKDKERLSRQITMYQLKHADVLVD